MTGDAPGTLAEACQLSRLLDSVSDLPTFAFAGSTLFGGQAMAFAVAAAARSAPPVRRPISVHATFLRGGRAGDNVSLEVAAVRFGSTLSHRAVVVYQHGQPLLQVSVLLAKEPADGTAGNLDGSAATTMTQLPPRASTDSYPTVFERAWSFPFLEFRRCVAPCWTHRPARAAAPGMAALSRTVARRDVITSGNQLVQVLPPSAAPVGA